MEVLGVDLFQYLLEFRVGVDQRWRKALAQRGVVGHCQLVFLRVLRICVWELLKDLLILIYDVEVIDDLHTILQGEIPEVLWLHFKDLQ